MSKLLEPDPEARQGSGVASDVANNVADVAEGSSIEEAIATFDALIAKTQSERGCTRRQAENLLSEGALGALRAAFVARNADEVHQALESFRVLMVFATPAGDGESESEDASPRREGPVDPVGYLLEQAVFLGIDPRHAIYDLQTKGTERILHALAEGDAEGVYAGADWLVQIAEFLRVNRSREGGIITGALSGERVRLLSVLQERHASLDLWRRKADRLLNLVMRMQNSQPFWPGPGATRGAETWRIIHDCMNVMLTFALNCGNRSIVNARIGPS